MTSSVSSASEKSFSRQWKEVESYLEKDLPNSAFDKVREIYGKAEKKGDGFQMLKSCVHMANIATEYREDYEKNVFDTLYRIIPLLKDEYKPLGWAILGNCYRNYFDSNQYRLRQNIRMETLPDDYSKWDIKTFADTVRYCLRQSITTNHETTSKIKRGKYRELLYNGNELGRNLRPTLLDALYANAIWDWNEELKDDQAAIFEDPRLYGTASAFLEVTDEYSSRTSIPWNIYVLSCQTAFHMYDGADVRASVDLSRFETLRLTSFCKRSLYDTALLELGEQYLPLSRFSTDFLSEYAHIIASENPVKAVETGLRAIESWPGSHGAVECDNLVNQIQVPALMSFSSWSDLPSNEVSLAELRYRNINRVWLKAVASAPLDLFGRKLIDSINNIPAEVSWSLNLENNGDYSDCGILISIPPLKPGSHYIVVSDHEAFGEEACIRSFRTDVSSLDFVDCSEMNGLFQGYVIDRMTGKPVDGCQYKISLVGARSGNREEKTLLAEGQTGPDGRVFSAVAKNFNGRNCMIELSKDGETFSQTKYLNTMGDRPMPGVIRLFTDRYTYRSGETVKLNCVVYKTDGFSYGQTVSDATVKISMLDANWQRIDTITVTTDKYGTASGSFVIPKGLLPGRFTLEAETENGENTAHRTINVEEFRQPTFIVKMSSEGRSYFPGDSVVISGSAVAYTGVPVNGASVSYTVEYLEPWLFRMPSSYSNHIQAGSTQTDLLGNFQICFIADAGKALSIRPESLSFRIRAEVTDLNGETHSETQIVTVGREVPYLNISGSDSYTDVPSFELMVVNAAGDFVEGQVSVKVERLTKPTVAKIPSPYNMDAGYGIDEELSDLFPYYDFDDNNSSSWQVQEVVFSKNVSTLKGEAYKLTLPGQLANGTYRISAVLEGTESSDTSMFISAVPGDTDMPANSMLVAVPLKESCEVGGDALILVGSAFSGLPVYYAIEDRLGIVKDGFLEPNGRMIPMVVRVTPEMKGGISVRFAAEMKRVCETRTVSIDVPYEDKKLDVGFVTFRDMLEPDKTETWELVVKDSGGNPVDAALTLGMYDQAMDAYGGNDWYLSPWSRMNPSYRHLINPGYVSQTGSWQPVRPIIQYKGQIPDYPRVISVLYGYSRLYKSARTVMSFASPSVANTNSVLLEDVASFGADEEGVADNSALKRVSVTDEISEMEEGVNRKEIAVRTNMNPTGFFITNVRTDKKGRAKFSFATPQLLTRWIFQGVAHTTDLKTGSFSKLVTTRKEIMVQPRIPRFLRQGDEFNFSAKVSNVTDKDLTTTVHLELTDPITGKSMNGMSPGSLQTRVNVPAGASADVKFPLKVPSDATAVTFRIVAVAQKHTDGQQETVPVLSSRTLVTESVSLFNNGNETRDFELNVLSDNLLSGTAEDRKLTLEYSPSPVWYAIQALPYLEETANPSNERLFHRFFANALSAYIIERNPAIAQMLERWADLPIDSWQTQLDKNEELKQTLLEETPWVLDSKSEKESLRRLAQAFTGRDVRKELENILLELIQKREPEGGWAWIYGYRPSVWVTNTILSGIANLTSLGAMNLGLDDSLTKGLKDALKSSLEWLDLEFVKKYQMTDRGKVENVGPDDIEWMLVHQRLPEFSFAQDAEETYRFLKSIAMKEKTHDLSLYQRASLVLFLAGEGEDSRAEDVARPIVERSLYDDEQGRFWRDNTGGWLWHQAPVETQSRIISALLAVGDRNSAAECGRWLLKQRQTTHWSTSTATAKAVVALLETGNVTTLSNPAVTDITIGREHFRTGGQSGESGYMMKKWVNPSASLGRISIKNDYPDIGWGALSIQYTEETRKVRYSENGISLKRTLFLVGNKDDDTILHEITDTDVLAAGDRLRVRIELSCDRNLEYVEVKDMRAASFEPLSTNAGFRYNIHDALSYYVVPGNASNMFYIDRLNRGSYVIEYDVYAEQEGTFSSGIVSAQCMYAPEFRSTASSSPVTVK